MPNLALLDQRSSDALLELRLVLVQEPALDIGDVPKNARRRPILPSPRASKTATATAGPSSGGWR